MSSSQDSFLKDGFVDLGPILDKESCKNVLTQINNSRSFSSKLFIDEEQHKKNPRWKKTNPGPGINFTEKVDLTFIEENISLQNILNTILGSNYNILLKKFVVGMPDDWIPKWVIDEMSNAGIANLGPFIKPEFHDVTYFHGIDFHQDLIDHPHRNADFITLYVYLDDVVDGMSPLAIIPKSHTFGATTFPHKIRASGKNDELVYEDRRGGEDKFKFKFLMGESGTIYFWSALTLHGTQPQGITKPRISLRYLIERSKSEEDCLIDKFNDSIDGPLSLESVREDISEKGKSVNEKGNTINQIKK